MELMFQPDDLVTHRVHGKGRISSVSGVMAVVLYGLDTPRPYYRTHSFTRLKPWAEDPSPEPEIFIWYDANTGVVKFQQDESTVESFATTFPKSIYFFAYLTTEGI